MKVLLVTGARVLDDNDASREWARAILRDAVAQHDVVVHGNARGPDTWADEAAADSVPRIVFSLVAPGEPVVRYGASARPAKNAARYRYDPRNPLSRNDAMVRRCVDAAANGHEVDVIAFRSKRATTNGTAYTVRRAREARLFVAEMWEPEVVK